MAAYERNQQQQGPSPSTTTTTTTRPMMPFKSSSFSFEEEIETPSRSRSRSINSNPPPIRIPGGPNNPNIAAERTSTTSSLAAKAIRASSAHMDSSLSSAYVLSPSPSSPSSSSPSSFMDSNPYEYTSMKNLNDSKRGFWGALARKAKAILDDDNATVQSQRPGRTRLSLDTETADKHHNPYPTPESHWKSEGPIPTPALQKGLGAIASSLNSIGGAIGNALEEGLTVVENRTADIIQETRKLHIRKKGSGSRTENQAKDVYSTRQQPSIQNQMPPQMQTDQDIQLKASRDVAMAMAAKAKLLLRELKTVKADLAFAKDRCAQLEEENRILRENREKGSNLEDDDLIRLQLETLLAEKARLAQENSVYARENRFLREVVEYHQLTMQDVVYLNEGTEEVTEVQPIRVPSGSLQANQHVFPVPMPPVEFIDVSKSAALQGSDRVSS